MLEKYRATQDEGNGKMNLATKGFRRSMEVERGRHMKRVVFLESDEIC